jgi:hypothetical protein
VVLPLVPRSWKTSLPKRQAEPLGQCASTLFGPFSTHVSMIYLGSCDPVRLTGPTVAAADPYLSTFAEIVQRAADIPDLRLTVSVFYTRGADNASGLKTRLPPNIQIKSGRPDLLEELGSVLDRTQHAIGMHQSPKNGVILAACGPDQLISSVYAAKAGAPPAAQQSVGGLELHTE